MTKKTHKIREWLVRYVPSEIAAVAMSYLGFMYCWKFSNHNLTAASYGSAMAENIGFYGVMFIREFFRGRREAIRAHRRYGFSAFAKTFAGLLVEFGPSETLDSLVIRPLTVGLAVHFFGIEFGVLAGKLSADLAFFIPTIAIYEMKKSYHAKKNSPHI